MRKAWSLVLTPVVALAVSTALTTPAHAFGAETLGCGVDGAPWGQGVCSSPGTGVGEEHFVEFAVHNLSGTYTFAWTAPADCSTTTPPCSYSGCTATASICDIDVRGGPLTRKFTVSVKLTQSGHSRTLSATATIFASPICCE